MTSIFVSHAMGDSDIAGPLVDALEEFLEISRNEITCVGVVGCSQPTIGPLPDLLRREIESCKAFFLILTKKSVGSAWVLGEAGAAWALGKTIVPILSHDLRDDQIPPFLSGRLFVRGDLTNVESFLPSLFGDLSTIIGVQKRKHPRTEKLSLLISKLHSRISERPEPLLYKYGVGRFTANVFLGLLDGNDEGLTRESVQFAYSHKWKALPDPIEQKRDVWIKDMDQDAKIHGKVFFNGPAIRLDSLDYNPHSGTEVKTPVLEFRPTCWHDYAISNKQIDESVLVPGKGLVSIRNEYADTSRLISSRNVNWVELSNILTVSIVLVTRDNWTLIGQRTSRVDNASLIVAASAAENIHRWLDEPSVAGDFWSPPRWLVEDDRARRVRAGTDDEIDYRYEPAACPNPFQTVLRGINEEVGKEVQQAVSLDDINFLCVAWDIKGFNPHIYAFARVDLPLSDVRRIVSASRGTDNWEANLLPVPFEPGGLLERYLADEEWAEISKGAVLRALVHEYGFNEVDRAFR